MLSEARAPNNYELAEQDYLAGMKYKDIAEKYNVTLNTVKSWKTRYGWSKGTKKGVHTKEKKVCTQKEAVASEVDSVMNNDSLTDKQRLFCLYYSKTFNATQSYQKAYGCTYATALVNGPTLLGKTRIREQITQLKEMRYAQALLKPEDIFQKYLEIAYADMTAFTTFGIKEVEYIDKSGNERKAEVSYVDINESTDVDGTLISEISQGKEGIKVKLADRMKALQWLTDHMELATEEQKARIELFKAQKEKADIDIARATGKADNKELSKLDKILEQIKEQAGGVNDSKS